VNKPAAPILPARGITSPGCVGGRGLLERNEMKAIKGFDKNLQCRGFQFETGKTYTHEGDVRACESGFHAIPDDQHPLAVFSYYAPAGSRFCLVEYDGKIATKEDKIAAEILTVGKEISLTGLTLEAVKWVAERATPEGETATGYQGAASATGYQGAASATGTRGAASATGDLGAASATGTRGAAMSSGCDGKVMGAEGNALFAVERKTWDGPIISVAAGIVGQDGIKAKTWYVCKSGKLTETE